MEPQIPSFEAAPSLAAGLEAPNLDLGALPPRLRRELRASHVGETVAVSLYDGILAVSNDADLHHFAVSHRAVEREHLRLFDALVPAARRSRLMGFWRWSGRMIGGLPARLGPEYVYAVVAGVEGWVDGHYARQIALVQAEGGAAVELLSVLNACRADEATHSEDAVRLEPKPPRGARVLAGMAVGLSRVGVRIAKWV